MRLDQKISGVREGDWIALQQALIRAETRLASLEANMTSNATLIANLQTTIAQLQKQLKQKTT